jgi:hypothetical protein
MLLWYNEELPGKVSSRIMDCMIMTTLAAKKRIDAGHEMKSAKQLKKHYAPAASSPTTSTTTHIPTTFASLSDNLAIYMTDLATLLGLRS